MKKVLFNVSFLYHRATFDPVIEVFRKDPVFDIYVSCENEVVNKFFLFNIPIRKRIEEEFKKEGLKTTRSKKGFDIVVTGDTIRDARKYGRVLFAYIGHGTAIKTVVYNNLIKFKDTKYVIFPEGDYVKEQYEKFLKGTKSIIMETIGSPKLDPIFSGKIDIEGIKAKLNLEPDKPIILYAPTYKPTSIFYLTKDDHLFKLTRKYNLIVKLHHYSWMGKYAPHKQHRIFEKKLREYNFYLVPQKDYNILPYLAISDVLITEASSVMSDFLALEKLAVIFDLPMKDQTRHDGSLMLEMPNSEFFKDAFIHIDDPSDLEEAIELALSKPEDRMKRLKEYADYMFSHRDGKSSLRLLNKVKEIMDNDYYINEP